MATDGKNTADDGNDNALGAPDADLDPSTLVELSEIFRERDAATAGYFRELADRLESGIAPIGTHRLGEIVRRMLHERVPQAESDGAGLGTSEPSSGWAPEDAITEMIAVDAILALATAEMRGVRPNTIDSLAEGCIDLISERIDLGPRRAHIVGLVHDVLTARENRGGRGNEAAKNGIQTAEDALEALSRALWGVGADAFAKTLQRHAKDRWKPPSRRKPPGQPTPKRGS